MSRIYNKQMDKHKFQEKYGLDIKIERIKRKITQEELAEKAGCSSVHIGYIERGIKCPTMYQFLKIARILELDLNEFFKEF